MSRRTAGREGEQDDKGRERGGDGEREVRGQEQECREGRREEM